MIAYVEQRRRSEKRVNLIEGRLQILRLLLSNDQSDRIRLISFVDFASDILLVKLFHHDLLFSRSGFLVFRTMFLRRRAGGGYGDRRAVTVRVSDLRTTPWSSLRGSRQTTPRLDSMESPPA